jgi:hypothetical protein
MRHDGGLLIALGAGLGLLISVFNFLSPVALLAPTTSVAWTPGAGLAVAATLVLLLAGLVLGGSTTNRALVGFLIIGSLLGILGTGLAAWLLESPLLLALMAMCLVGWLLRVLTRHSPS